MARVLLRYRPVDDLYEEWLDYVAELVSAAWGSPAPSLSLPGPPPAAGDVAHEAPPLPLPQDSVLAPRRAPPGATHRVGRPREKKEASKRFPGRKKTLLRSRRHHDKTACRLRWRCTDIKGRLCLCKGPRWPQ